MKALRFVKNAKILDPDERESLNSLYIHLKELKKLMEDSESRCYREVCDDIKELIKELKKEK